MSYGDGYVQAINAAEDAKRNAALKAAHENYIRGMANEPKQEGARDPYSYGLVRGSPTAPSLFHFVDRLREATKFLESHANELHGLADNLVGSLPPAPEPQTSQSLPQGGLIGQFQAAFERLEEQQTRLARALDRMQPVRG